MMKQLSTANKKSSFPVTIISFIAILICIVLLQFAFQPNFFPARPMEMGQVVLHTHGTPPAPPEDPLSVLPSKAGLLISTTINGTFLSAAMIPSLQAHAAVSLKGNWALFHINEEDGMPGPGFATGAGYSVYGEEGPVTTIAPASNAVFIKDSVVDEEQ